MRASSKKMPPGRFNSPRANVRTSSKKSVKNEGSRASATVRSYPCVPEALVHPLSARMLASQRAIAKACGVADSTVGRLVAAGEIRRIGQLLDLADALEAVGNRPRPGRPARSPFNETNRGGRML
jgi:hypothetical protein